ncbi:DUF7509 family protein [Halostagnicola kamekurae]|uniref:DUF7509 domain-containing protein n=1 Tax=Halostagnicola kamekurae TaxID=619731 RepID=A0A1I6RRF4_9EURY|nr:hypothetical protein [Halostagnicola kamekurae]SFS67323.1 hypothetical protein SAMN04488556_2029 [Halostagnicola kamekurae]
MRDRLIAELGDLQRPRFLVYLMGPYEAFDVDRVLEESEPDSIPESVDFGTLVDSEHALEREEATLDLLLDVRDRLRIDAGVNVFLAIDVDIPLAEMDAATQSIEFARASNAVVYVVPAVGDNLGVGIETGAVLEALFSDELANDRQERVLFVHESSVRSAMIAAVRDRWEARIYAYDDRSDLVRQVRLFVRDLVRKERTGELSRLE